MSFLPKNKLSKIDGDILARTDILLEGNLSVLTCFVLADKKSLRYILAATSGPSMITLGDPIEPSLLLGAKTNPIFDFNPLFFHF